MIWRVEYTKRFLKELASLPKDVQQRAEMIVFQELNSTNPRSNWDTLRK
jgi:mRNA interferase RelE/StbE